MGLTVLGRYLRRHRLVALDTSIFIYQLEANERNIPLANEIFRWLENEDSRAVTSTLTMTELLAGPYRNADDQLVDEYFALLSRFPHLTWTAPDLEIADIAAKLRAQHRLRTPDALLAATALSAGATGLISNDAVFRRVPGIECLILDDLLAPS